MFINALGKPHSNLSFSKFVQRVAAQQFDGKTSGVSLCRHVWATALDYNTQSITELEAIAARMGHSQAMQHRYRFQSLRDPEAAVNA